MANKSKFSVELGKKLCNLHSNGLPAKACAKKCRIDRKTLYNWIKWGEKPSSKYHQFYLDWEEADANYQMYHLNKINKSDDWRASRYLLEVNDPECYVVPDKIENDITLNDNEQITKFSDLFDDDDPIMQEIIHEEEEDS